MTMRRYTLRLKQVGEIADLDAATEILKTTRPAVCYPMATLYNVCMSEYRRDHEWESFETDLMYLSKLNAFRGIVLELTYDGGLPNLPFSAYDGYVQDGAKIWFENDW